MRKKSVKAFTGKPMIPIHFPQPCFDNNPYKGDGAIGPTYVRPKDKAYKNLAKWTPNGGQQGGCHDGCFNKLPPGMPDRFVSEFEANKKPGVTKGKYFYPQSMALKSKQTTSILYQNTDRSCNVLNYETYNPNYVTYLVN